ncbi:alpha/beta fold hydrolase [Acaryochloris sp. IP29b_bin.137]|uniref:thioesterase II family protein n=1 Tax=Acaryochloris sp. IP29b_bin.137 TaxID=2969217 RepID=UPI00261B9328|nr:alpha/beta fold hydrolase [Acaryochloris sp. IP29b_bin.137]
MEPRRNPVNQRADNPWIPRWANYTDQPFRVFCFPYAGGKSYIYRNWSHLFPANIGISPVELPGRGHRFTELPYTHLTDLLKELGPALISELTGPFAFFGHSMGALIAFELTHWLRKNNYPRPRHLLLSGIQAPHTERKLPNIHNRSDEAFLENLRRYKGTPSEVLANKELMMLLLRSLRADFQIVESYSYHEQPPLDCPMSIFMGQDDETVDDEDVLSWEIHTTERCTFHRLPGEHFFIHTEEEELVKLCVKALGKYPLM